MSSHPQEPALKDETSAFRHVVVNRMILWCTKATTPYHWISSFAFKEHVTDGHLVYIGVSLNMWQPYEHELPLTVGDNSNRRGCLEIQVRKDKQLISKYAPVEQCISLDAVVTVGDLVDLIVSKNLQFYRFTEHGSGCMCWQLNFLRQMVGEGWILASRVDEVEQVIGAKKIEVGEALIPFPPQIGTREAPPVAAGNLACSVVQSRAHVQINSE